MSTNSYAKPQVLVETDWVAEHLDDPNVRLVEVDVDTTAYDSGHAPGAIGWNWKEDLQRHPVRDVPTREEWEQLLSQSGIGNDSTVILYGDNNNWFAAYAYWVFKLYGHEDVKLMNGGRTKWLAENRPLTTDTPSPTATSYTATEPQTGLRAFRDDVRDAIDRSNTVLIDVRSPGEFSGELLAPENLPQEGAQRGGHIPTAQNVPWASAVAEDGTFKSREDLESIYGNAGVSPDKEVYAYCRIGERSAHTWFVLRELLGIETVQNYDGSWTEWGSLIGSPIESGK